ncbi:uncharacterized protein LOC125522389 isoform X2 [Triticum urartu]|uniref:uncharacterized protein LOC125522389 isoform X2 n=1 Tax=Triticum urartu TaxID=4572 RepID=UPI002044348E|nr:uncharacterized protein LOC125522389 isoform X2 [Triticum urartu]
MSTSSSSAPPPSAALSTRSLLLAVALPPLRSSLCVGTCQLPGDACWPSSAHLLAVNHEARPLHGHRQPKHWEARVVKVEELTVELARALRAQGVHNTSTCSSPELAGASDPELNAALLTGTSGQPAVHKITNDFSMERKIGGGPFGNVYKGVVPDDGRVIAGKKHQQNAPMPPDKAFNNERLTEIMDSAKESIWIMAGESNCLGEQI